MREPRPITHVEVSDKNRRIRIIAAVALLVIGALALTVGITGLLNKDTGWQEVQANAQERSCSESFLFQYNFTGSGTEATALNKQLEAAYSEACLKAYQLFTPDEGFEGVQNIYYVNRHPNEVVTVDPVLYAAFEKLEGTPYLYLGPAYGYYYNLIVNAQESSLQTLDPAFSTEAKDYLQQIADFAADRNAVELQLLGNNQVKLYVGEDYLTFAQEEEIESFIDFAYLTNAFIIDYLADTMISKGLTDGYLVSVDGYTRNLCAEEKFNFNIFDRVENMVYPAGTMEYRGPVSIVFLKDYPTAASDVHYRVSGDRFIHLFVDPADGLCKTSTENLVSYSYDSSCTDVVLKMLPGFVGEQFALPQGVFSIWCEEDIICYNDDAITVGNLLRGEEISYRAVLKN